MSIGADIPGGFIMRNVRTGNPNSNQADPGQEFKTLAFRGIERIKNKKL